MWNPHWQRGWQQRIWNIHSASNSYIQDIYLYIYIYSCAFEVELWCSDRRFQVQIETETYKFNKQLGGSHRQTENIENHSRRAWPPFLDLCHIRIHGWRRGFMLQPAMQTLDPHNLSSTTLLPGMRSITLAGGLSKLEQFKEVKRTGPWNCHAMQSNYLWFCFLKL